MEIFVLFVLAAAAAHAAQSARQPARYSDKASAGEMAFAGTGLNALWLTGALLMAMSLLYQRHRDHLAVDDLR